MVTGLTLYNGSVIAELVRSGVFSLPKGQSEAGLSIGLTRGQTLRSIQLPAGADRHAAGPDRPVRRHPEGLGARATIITYGELLNWSKTLGSAYANTLPAYIVAAVLFIVINYLLTVLARYVERAAEQPGPHDAARHDGGADSGPGPGLGPRWRGSGSAAARVWMRRWRGHAKAPDRCGPGPLVCGSPGWTRTNNLPINSRLLCQLSYRGMVICGPGRDRRCATIAKHTARF